MNLSGAAYGAPGYVVTGDGGRIVTSADGSEWIERKSGTGLALQGVAYGSKGFVAVGDGGKILTSVDGAEWRAMDSGIDNSLIGLKGITYGGSGYVAVGDLGTIVTSADGVKWNKSASNTRNDLVSVKYCFGRYITTGVLDTPEKSLQSHRRVYVSADAKDWSAMRMSESLPLYDLACGDNRTLVVVGRKIWQSDALPDAN